VGEALGVGVGVAPAAVALRDGVAAGDRPVVTDRDGVTVLLGDRDGVAVLLGDLLEEPLREGETVPLRVALPGGATIATRRTLWFALSAM
jgi:hypothetical protein